MQYKDLIQQITEGNLASVYYLHGEETYLIDKIVELLEAHVLTESEAAFNKEVFYGAEATIPKVLNACQSFPVMAQRRLVLLKEAHQVNKKEWERIGSYLKQPVSSTVLVMAFKGKNTGLPKGVISGMSRQCVNFLAKKLYERDVQQWIEDSLREQQVKYDPGIPLILTTNLGINLHLIENELNKMLIYLKATGKQGLSKDFVFEMINIDRAFNVFELINALSNKESYRVHLIMDRLTQNIKLNPPVLTIGNLFRFYHQLALVHTFNLRDPNSIRHQLNVNYYAAKDYVAARQHYSLNKVYRNIQHVHEADQSIKGLIPTQMDHRHVLKTLAWKLL